MADQPKMTGVYDAPSSTSTAREHAGSGAKPTGIAGMPSWVWIVAAIVVLAIIGMMFL
jgi:hypothetical protein